MDFGELAGIFWENIKGYDAIVFVVAIVNVFLLLAVRRSTKRLHDALYMTVFMPEDNNAAAVMAREASLRESDIVEMRRKSGLLYELYVNVTAIFQLLGILGTVISLIPLVNMMNDATANFFVALTSTFWGLVFSIIFKMLDGFAAASMEENDKNVSLFLARNHREE